MAKINLEMASKIKKNIERWRNHWRDNHDTYNEWTQFIFGNQWLDDEARVFETYKKTPLTFNQLRPQMNNLLGNQRQNTPSLQILPDENSDVQTAEIKDALLKSIMFNSNARVAIQTAFQCAAAGGYGALLLGTDYDSENSFDQHITVSAVKIPTRCAWDLSAESESKTDGEFFSISSRMSRAKVKASFGEEVERAIGNEDLEDGIGTVFHDEDAITVVDYWERKYEEETLRQLSNNKIVNSDEFDALKKEKILYGGKMVRMIIDDGVPVTITNTRKVARYKIKHYKYVGQYEVEANDFPGKFLPGIFVDQNSFYNEQHKQITCPFFVGCYDAQRYINYIGTMSAYLLKISRYDQFMVSKQNVRSQDTQAIWRDPLNVQGGLVFDESPAGVIPERLKPPELPQSFIAQYERALQDIQTCSGVFNSMMGRQGNDISGAAVDARTKRGDVNTQVPFDALNRALFTAGEIINDMIPEVYDTHRVMNLAMKDKGDTMVEINKPMGQYEGSPVMNDMTKGSYKIKIIPGPSSEGQKQEMLDAIELITKNSPQSFMMLGDLFAENLPVANTLELRNRLRAMVPQEIIQAGKTGDPIPPKPPQPDPQMIAAQAKMGELQIKQQQLQLEQQKLQIQAQETGHNIQLKYAELESAKEEAAAELQAVELKYLAEVGRTMSNEKIASSDQLIKLLTHTHKQQSNGVMHDANQ